MLAAPLLKNDGGAMDTWGCFCRVTTSARPAMMFTMDWKKSARAWSALCSHTTRVRYTAIYKVRYHAGCPFRNPQA